MPTYEYECSKCGHHFEQFQSMKDAPLKQCPKCKKAGLKRLIGAGAGLIFKGTGFYITDYKKTPAKKEGGEGKSGESKPSEGKSGGGESKGGESKAGESKAPAAAPKPASKPES